MAELLIIIFSALIISFMCSVLEACVLSLSVTDIASISEKKPLIAKIWKYFKDNIQIPITVILIINTLAHTIGAALSGAKFDQLFGGKWITLFSVVFSYVMIQWTEILPKTLGVRYNKDIAVASAFPLKFLIFLFTPFVKIVQFVNWPFRRGLEKKAEADITKDISVLARFAALHDIISKDQEKIVSQTIKLSKIKVSDIMVKRDEIKYLSTLMSLQDALIEAHIHHHTRLPLVSENNKDDVIGYVNFKDIVSALQTNPKDPSLKGIRRPILEVRDNESLSIILNKLTRGYQHIAIVKDDRGKVAGLVTLEDIVETVIGGVQDEYDILPTYLYQIAANRYVAGGGITLKILREKTGFDLPDSPEPLNEWLLKLFGALPKVEEKVSFKKTAFIIRKVRRSNIHEVIIETENVK